VLLCRATLRGVFEWDGKVSLVPDEDRCLDVVLREMWYDISG
jgi:hypothetical protein